MTSRPTFLTVTTVAKQLGKTRQTIYSWLDKGRLTRYVVAETTFVVNDKKMTDARKANP